MAKVVGLPTREDAKRPVTASFLCEVFNINPSTLSQWITSGIVVRVGHGAYDLPKSVQGAIDEVRGRRDLRKGSFTEHRIGQMKAQTALAELKLQEAAGELMRLDTVEALLLPRVDALNKKIWAMPATMAQQLARLNDPAKIQELLQQRINEAFDEVKDLDAILSEKTNTSEDSGTETDGEDLSDAVPETAPKKSKRVGRPRAKIISRVKRAAGKVANKHRTVHARSNGRGRRQSR